MSNRVVWTPSTDLSIDHYELESSADALTWGNIATITHDLNNTAVFDAVAGVFYHLRSEAPSEPQTALIKRTGRAGRQGVGGSQRYGRSRY